MRLDADDVTALQVFRAGALALVFDKRAFVVADALCAVIPTHRAARKFDDA